MTTARKPTVPEVPPLVVAYYAKSGHGAGGNLHIVLDDENVDDGQVQFCLDLARRVGDADGVQLAELLLRMSKTQRLKLACSWRSGVRPDAGLGTPKT